MKNSCLKTAIIVFTFSWLAPAIARAAIEHNLEMPLPGMSSTIPTDPGVYVRWLFIFGLSALGFLAVGMIVFGGIQYIMAGSLTSTEKARETIKGAVLGLVLLLCSYLLLYTIDPSLTNLSPIPLKPIDVQAMADEFDIPTTGIGDNVVRLTVQEGRILGSGQGTCSVSDCGQTSVQGHILSNGAAYNYNALKGEIEQACASQGISCSTVLTSTLDGQHDSSCHKLGNNNSGKCGDFVITASECGGSIKNCSTSQQTKYVNTVTNVLAGAGKSDVRSCLNEYVVSTQYTTGKNFHCNF